MKHTKPYRVIMHDYYSLLHSFETDRSNRCIERMITLYGFTFG